MEPASILGIVVLATFIEGLITYVFGESSESSTRPWVRYVALVVGIAAAIAYKIDILAMAGLTAAYPYVGYVVSGLVIGRGSNYVNDFVSLIRGSAK